MRRRFAFVLVCAVVLMLSAALAAQAAQWAGEGRLLPPTSAFGIETIEPHEGRAGATLRVDMTGHFLLHDVRPTFRLSLPGVPGTVITGEVVTFFVTANDGEAVTVRFVLPQAAVPGVYTLTAYSAGEALQATAEFVVWPPTPSITRLEPASVDALGRSFDLGVVGTGFSTASRGGSVVYWNGTALTTTRDSAVRLTASVPAALIASPGAASVTVRSGTGWVTSSSAAVQCGVLTPVPSISSLTPESAVPGGAAFELRVLGARFLPGAVVTWNGMDLATRRVSSVLLEATVPAALTARPGQATVSVRNGAPSAPESVGVTFTLAYPTPSITALSPRLVRAGGPAFDLEVTGTKFMTGAAGAVVRWNDTDLVTARDSAIHLTARVPATLTANARAVDITVRNGPAVGGKVSHAFAFTVGAGPAITGLEPAGVVAGTAALTLTVKGTNFVDSVALPLPGTTGSRVEWNGERLVTTYKSATRLEATVPAAKLAAAGVARITVRNVTEGVVSNARAFTITDAGDGPGPDPGPDAGLTLTALDPVWAPPGGPAFSLGVKGTGFLAGAAGAVVRWNDTDLDTTRLSATRLTATVPAALIAVPGSASITVRNGVAAGDPLTEALTFTVGAPPALSVTSIEPATVWAGCTKNDLVLAIGGAGFVSGARIVIAGKEMEDTAFESATKLTVPIPISAMATAGTVAVGVKNPPFPPGTKSAGIVRLVAVAESTDPVVTIAGADAGWHNVPVPLTISATDGESGIHKVEYKSAPAVPSWRSGTSYTVPVATEGAVVVQAQAYDWCGRVGSASATVNIDTTKPGTEALRNAEVTKGKAVRLRYRVTEPDGLSPTASVVIRIKRANGKTVKTLRVADVPVNDGASTRFTCRLRKGRYTWYVYATDLAGNRQENVARAPLRVR